MGTRNGRTGDYGAVLLRVDMQYLGGLLEWFQDELQLRPDGGVMVA